jgi:Mo25-like
VFVANPNKTPAIVDILAGNKEKLLRYLKDFHNDTSACPLLHAPTAEGMLSDAPEQTSNQHIRPSRSACLHPPGPTVHHCSN